MQAAQLTADQEDLEDDDSGYDGFLAGLQAELSDDESALADLPADLKASSTPPAATQWTRTLPELPSASSSPVLGAPAPCHSQGLGVRCLHVSVMSMCSGSGCLIERALMG